MVRLSTSILFVTSTLLILSGCGSTPVTRTLPSRVAPVETPASEDVSEQLSPEALIILAEQHWQTDSANTQAQDYLIQAAELWQTAGESLKAQQIVYSLRNTSLPANLQARYNLLLAHQYADDPKVSSEQILALLSGSLSDAHLRQQQFAIKANQYARLGQWLQATDALLQSTDITPDIVNHAWNWVNRASVKDEASVARLKAVTPFVSLKQLVREHGFDQANLIQQLINFRQVYRGHPLVTYWPESLTKVTDLEPVRRDNVAVFLPLSGRLQATGMAIKEGILAAYFNDQSAQRANQIPLLQFVDTNSTTPEQLAAIAAEADWVIGPLLKENVDALLPLLSPKVKMLALNRPDAPLSPLAQASEELLPSSFGVQIFYALAPEDEARQLANEVFEKGKSAPILVASEQSLHQRMQEAFIDQWAKLTAGLASHQHSAPTLVTYTDNAGLRDGIQEALDVAQSKERIKEIQGFVDDELYNLPRNRLDIDAIVVFASPEQTELLNPVIEASISPFNGESVPVFATSRSVDYSKSRNQWRDLQNLHFLDMPWVLPTNPNKQLEALTKELWPQRPTSLQRLFAFGVDAYNIIPLLGQMVWLPQLEYQGLTGTLKINGQREVVRKLPEAVVNQEAIQLVGTQ
ncbi:penicillin-binding protein activator [Alteromonas sp. AMM-1]|uniref:penicillin-binding protein activator n=1 Tax=Alteromonas sp. AMM-1 TaxID=3394233 RepID=UPI0039A5D238